MSFTTMIQAILNVILIASLQGVLGGRSGLTRFYIITVPSFMSTWSSKQQFASAFKRSTYPNELSTRSQPTQHSRCGCLHTISSFNHATWKMGGSYKVQQRQLIWLIAMFLLSTTHTWWVCKLHLREEDPSSTSPVESWHAACTTWRAVNMIRKLDNTYQSLCNQRQQ